MIFLTIGSHEPFDRLVRAFDQWAATAKGVDIFGQITNNGGHVPQHFQHVPYLDAASYARRCAEARLLVAHAGMGSIITALDLGKPIVIMPRRGHLQETRNDHQFATAKKFAGKPGIFVAEDETSLGETIDRALLSLNSQGRVSSAGPFAQTQLIQFLTGVFAGKDGAA